MPLNFGGQKKSGVFDTVWPSATLPTRQWCRAAPRKARADRTRHRLAMPQQPDLCLEPKWLRCLATARRTIADSTRRSSQAVAHPNTNRALCRLTSEVRRDPVFSATVWPSAKSMHSFTIIEESHYQHSHFGKKNCLHFSICACHPCAGAMLIFSVSFQFFNG